MDAGTAAGAARIIGRYALYGEIASGGMASVHFGRLVGPAGFSRTVAIKRLHPQFARDPEFVSMFLDEARVAARIQHPNVVATLDVVPLEGEVFLVLEYVQGESLSRLVRATRTQGYRMPPRIAAAIVANALHGLHAAHEAKSERGEPLNIVHRDVSPQNIMVGVDGVARVLDFGVAKAAMRAQNTRDGELKGKVRYMAPEQLRGHVDRRTDVFAAGLVLWEALAGQRLFDADDPMAIMIKVTEAPIVSPRTIDPSIPPAIEAPLMRALERDPAARYQTAREFAIDLEHAGVALPREVGEWVEHVSGEALSRRAERMAEIESVSSFVTLPAEVPTSPSQVTNLSVTSSSSPDVPRSRGALWAALLGVALALGIALVVATVFLLRPHATSANAASAPPAPASAPVAVTSAAPAPAPPPVAPTSASAEPSAAPSAAEAAASATPPPIVKPRVVTPQATAHAVSAPAKPRPKTAKPDCAVPYTVDQNGIKHPRPECL